MKNKNYLLVSSLICFLCQFHVHATNDVNLLNDQLIYAINRASTATISHCQISTVKEKNTTHLHLKNNGPQLESRVSVAHHRLPLKDGDRFYDSLGRKITYREPGLIVEKNKNGHYQKIVFLVDPYLNEAYSAQIHDYTKNLFVFKSNLVEIHCEKR
jgi:hypothetical protein